MCASLMNKTLSVYKGKFAVTLRAMLEKAPLPFHRLGRKGGLHWPPNGWEKTFETELTQTRSGIVRNAGI